MNSAFQHRDAYKQALKDKDQASLLNEKAWLTTLATSALLNQETAAMSEILACCADLAPLADHFDLTGKPGDHWRAISDVLSVAMRSGKPLQQLRLMFPSTVSGLLIKYIYDQPGITAKELATRSQKTPPHISNEIKKLENERLIYRIKKGREHEIFLSKLGKDIFEDTRQVKLATEQKTPRTYPHADQNRVAKITQQGVPELPFNRVAR